jgi:hypothetical protein
LKQLRMCVAGVAVLVAVAAVYGVAAAPAQAVCDQFHTYDTECVLSTFGGGYSTIRAFTSTAGGTWTASALIDYNLQFEFYPADDKVGVQNNHANTIWVNSLHTDNCS